MVLSQQRSDRKLRVNHDYAAMTLTYDLAVFTTEGRVEYFLNIAESFDREKAAYLRAIGYPMGSFDILDQSEAITYEDDVFYTIPMDGVIHGVTSGSPFLDANGAVVAVLSQSLDKTNLADATKLEHLQGFLSGDIPWTACRDHASTSACIDAAIKQTERIAEAGDAVAQYELGRKGYLNPDGNMVWLAHSAEQGFTPAEVTSGFLANDAQNWREARNWFALAAKKGDPSAKSKLAFLYYDGNGVLRNRSLAFDLFHDAAKSGHNLAQYNVGRLYERGVGVEGSAASLAKGRCVIRGLPVHLMILRWPDGPVAMPWPRSGRTVRDRRRARRSGPRRQCRPGGRTSRPGPCAARASPRSP